MKTVLYPAIALMNRLSFGMKFSLISVLFFLPMLVTNFYLVRDSYRQFVGTESALESLELLGQSLQLRRDLESLNDLVQINSMIGQSGQAGDLESRIGQLQQALSAGLQGLEPVTQDAEQAAEFVSKRDELLADLKSAEGETSLQSKAVIVEKLLGSSQVFIKLVASQAGLSQDPQRQVRQITELITNVTPQITDVLSQGRAIGAYSLGQGFLNSAASTKFDDLLLQLEKLHAEYGLNLQEALAGSVAAQNGLGGLAEASRQSLKDSAVLFEDQVIIADSLDTPWAQFYEQVSQQMAKTYAFNDGLLAFLDSQLSERLTENRAQMVLLVVALVVVFLLIVYLYSGFYVSTRSTLKTLGQVMDKVAAGDMTVTFQAQSRDELGELGQVFNQTVMRIHDLIERVGHTVGEVGGQADRVELVSGESNQAVAGQRAQIEQVATAMNQMSATAQEVARSAAAAVSSAQSVNQETVSGRALVESQVGAIQRLAGEIDQSVAVIDQLASDSAAISQVLDVIKGIAEQTNLLALNAAIEAARAGEQGRGFAVVADEVRSLAIRSRELTGEIDQTIERLRQQVGSAVKIIRGSHQSAAQSVEQVTLTASIFEDITDSMGQIIDHNVQIASAAEQQAAVVQGVEQNTLEIKYLSESNAQEAQSTVQVSGELTGMTRDLHGLIANFRV